MSEGGQATTFLVTAWLVGAAVGGGLYAFSKSQFPTLSEKSERYRKLILVGFVPCCGINVFMAVIYYVMFLALAKVETNRARKAEQSLSRGLGNTSTSPGANPFGPGERGSPAAGPTESNPFGEPPRSPADDSDNPFA